MPDESPLLPLPIHAEYAVRPLARSVLLSNPTRGLAISEPCASDNFCLSLLKDAYERVVVGSIEAQRGLAPWTLSRHKEFSLRPPQQPTAWLPALEKVNVAFDNENQSSVAELLPEFAELQTRHERYKLTVDTTGAAEIVARTAWGVLHAFETLAQLFGCTETGGMVIGRLPLSVEDEPRFAWRGLMVDVARHFMPVKKLKTIVDAMASFKLNVLHLHLTDAQSFPFAVSKLPKLQDSVFHSQAVYLHWDWAVLIAYAKQRGIMIVPEIDIPGHTASWRFLDKDVVADCFSMLVGKDGYYENRVALNPASNVTWAAIATVLEEVKQVFTTSGFVHVGGDEVVKACWENCNQIARIREWMAAQNITTMAEVERTFDLYTQRQVVQHQRVPIVWDECFSNGNVLDTGTIVHAWRSMAVFERAVKAGHRAVLSYGFYQDRQDPLCSGTCTGINWMFSRTYLEMYGIDPTRDRNFTPAEVQRILGGEATLFAESTAPDNFDAMAFGRLGAFAERFWSSADVTEPRFFERRSQQLRCLMVRRGISSAGPLSSDHCETHSFY